MKQTDITTLKAAFNLVKDLEEYFQSDYFSGNGYTSQEVRLKTTASHLHKRLSGMLNRYSDINTATISHHIQYLMVWEDITQLEYEALDKLFGFYRLNNPDRLKERARDASEALLMLSWHVVSNGKEKVHENALKDLWKRID